MTDTLDLVKLRCPIEQCRTLRIPAGTDMTACLGVDKSAAIVNGETCKAGRWFIQTNVVGIILNDISVTAGAKTSAEDGVLLVYAPRIRLPKSVTATIGVFATVGDAGYWDNTAAVASLCNTLDGSGSGATPGELSVVGYVLETAAEAITEVDFCLMGDRLEYLALDTVAVPDITTILTT